MTVRGDYNRLRGVVVSVLAGLIILSACAQPLALRRSAESPTLTPSVARTSTTTASPVPRDQLLSVALDQRAAGEYQPMAASLEELLRQDPEPGLRRRATFHLAEARQLAGSVDSAVEAWNAFLAEGTHDEWSVRARFFLARAYEQLGRHADAITAYRQYGSLNPLIAPYAAERQAAQEGALGDRAAMLDTYERAAAQPIARSQRAQILERLISAYGEQQRPDLQLARYADLVAIAAKPEYRAQLLLRAARTAAEAADGTRQVAWLRELTERHPERPEAVAAIHELEALGAAGPPLPLARSMFSNGQFSEAVTRFDRALEGALPDADRLEARRMRALALRATGSLDEALAELRALATGASEWSGKRQAELDATQTLGHTGDIAGAITGYRAFAASYPADALAPEALWRAIQLEERSDEPAAMRAAIELGRRYGASEQAHAALARAAPYFQGQNARAEAVEAWQLLGRNGAGSKAAQGRFWAGALLIEAGDAENGQTWLRSAVEAAPESYFAARSRELLGDQKEGGGQGGSGPSQAERVAVEQWIASWTKRPAVHVDDGWLPEIASSPEVLRARELGMLHLRSEARDEWFEAKETWNGAPEKLWQLAVLATLEQQPYVALKLAEEIVALSPDGRITLQTPPGLLKLIFPLPYARAARQYAEQSGIDPLLLYAVLRQESLFNADATSWAGARGLAQVMPSTAEGIAGQLGINDFVVEQLWMPAVSLRFGAWYLGQQLRTFGSVQAAAAAYNGGPGNAARWIELTGDTDRMVEMIDYRETRDYVKRVYGNWGMYRMLYAE